MRLEWIEGIAPIAGKVLDVGCGGGILADAMARKGPRFWASTWPTRRSRWRNCMRWKRDPGVKYRSVSAEALAAESRKASTS